MDSVLPAPSTAAAAHAPPPTDTPPPLPALAHRQPRGTPLAVFADQPVATLKPYYKPATGVTPIEGKPIHIATMLDGMSALLVCFRRAHPEDWAGIRHALDRAQNTGLPTLLVTGSMSLDELGSALFGSDKLCGRHGLQLKHHFAVFVMSEALACALTIQDGRRIHNGIILVKGGCIVARSFTTQPDVPHAWGPIDLALSKDGE